MPYIDQSKRDVLEASIASVVDALRQLESDDPDNNFEGNLNYTFTSIINRVYNTSYRSINDVVGVLECVKQEFYSRVATPYEKQKAYENGDVYEEIQPPANWNVRTS